MSIAEQAQNGDLVFNIAAYPPELGVLLFKDGMFSFKGDADKSARAFLAQLQGQFDLRMADLEAVAQAARMVKGCKCSPAGSGEEFCTGACYVRDALKVLDNRKVERGKEYRC